ncbi:MAG: GNAT family protein, partial [Ligilactobacillus agilis]|nr:GNAT family protein [Ligilactobacillus agilis]
FVKVIEYLFNNFLWLNRIEATHDTQNPNSGKVMQKYGLQFEGVLRQRGKNNQGLVDIAMYSILRADYEFSSQAQLSL